MQYAFLLSLSCHKGGEVGWQGKATQLSVVVLPEHCPVPQAVCEVRPTVVMTHLNIHCMCTAMCSSSQTFLENCSETKHSNSSDKFRFLCSIVKSARDCTVCVLFFPSCVHNWMIQMFYVCVFIFIS